MGNTKAVKSHDAKNSMVAELYALRAGLSVISQRTEEVRNYEDEIGHENERVTDIQSNIDTIIKKTNDLKSKAGEIESKVNSVQSNYTKSVGKLADEKHYKNAYDKDSMLRGAIYTFIAGIIVLGISIFFNSMTSGDGSIFIFYFISGILFVIPVIILIVRALRHKRFVKFAKIDVSNKISADKIQIKEIESQVSALSKEKSRLYEERREIKEEVDCRIEEINEKINDIAYGVSVYNNVLEKTYARLLNPADWQNIDLCIFYLQTGRADTIKECLQLVDRQRQNDEIVGAIYAASNKICDEIRGGFIALGSTMVTCLNALSNQMEVMTDTLSSQHAEAMRALGSIEENSAQILSASQLNNALLEKANSTSEELLEDYKYVQSRYGITVL